MDRNGEGEVENLALDKVSVKRC